MASEKVNLIRILTETLYAIAIVNRAGYTTILSHHFGEAEVAHLAVAIKAELGAQAQYPGKAACFKRISKIFLKT